MISKVPGVLFTFLTAGGAGLFLFLKEGEEEFKGENLLNEVSWVGKFGSEDRTSENVINTHWNKSLETKVKQKWKNWITKNKNNNGDGKYESEDDWEELDTLQEIGRRDRWVSFDGENDKGVSESEIIGTKFADWFNLPEGSKEEDIKKIEFDSNFSKDQNFWFRANWVWGPGFDFWVEKNLNKKPGDLEINIGNESWKIVGLHEYSIGRWKAKDNTNGELWGDKSGDIEWIVVGRDLDLERRENSKNNGKLKDVCVWNLGGKSENPFSSKSVEDLYGMDRFAVMNDFRGALGDLIEIDGNESFGLKLEDDKEKKKIMESMGKTEAKDTNYENFDIWTQWNWKMMCFDGESWNKSLSTSKKKKDDFKKWLGEWQLWKNFLFEKNKGDDVRSSLVNKKKFKWGWGWKKYEVFKIEKKDSEKEYKSDSLYDWVDVEKKDNGESFEHKSNLESWISSGNWEYKS